MSEGEVKLRYNIAYVSHEDKSSAMSICVQYLIDAHGGCCNNY